MPTSNTTTSPTATSPSTRPLPLSARISSLVAGFSHRPGISARSVIVTIFGDLIVPAGGRIWLGELIELCQPFGFSHRLVRTSVYRLATEGWFETERIGRRSRYGLTERATAEFAEAEARIYHLPDPRWDGRWTVVFLDSGLLAAESRDTLRASLRWHGYTPVSAGVLAVPRVEPDQVKRLAVRAGIISPVPVATAEFGELASLVAHGWLAEAFGIETAAARYTELLDRYRGLVPPATPATCGASVSDLDAFALRTMLAHDLRRARLADPDLPAELLPAGWPAPAAMALAGSAYRWLLAGSERWLSRVTGQRARADGPVDPDQRFSSGPA